MEMEGGCRRSESNEHGRERVRRRIESMVKARRGGEDRKGGVSGGEKAGGQMKRWREQNVGRTASQSDIQAGRQAGTPADRQK